MTRLLPTPEEMHDWRTDRHGLDRPRPVRDLWVAGLIGAWCGGLAILGVMAVLESLPRAGTLNGCAAYPAECTAFAEGR